MVIQNKALIFALEVLMSSQYTNNMHANELLVNSANWLIKQGVTTIYSMLVHE